MHFHDFQEKAKKVKPKVEIREPSEEEEVVVTIEKPPPAEPTYTTWKRARIFPMIFKKVRGLADRRGIIDLEEEEWQRRLEEEDKDYLKLTLDQDEATESTVESEEESSSDYTEYSEEESEFSESETTEEESESETPSEEEESSTPESEESESTESEGEKARKNIFIARRRPVVEDVKEVKGRKKEPAEEPEELKVEEEEEHPAEEQKSELAPVEEPTDLQSRDVTEEGSAGSQGWQRKALTTPLGLLPRSPLGHREGVLGTELDLDRIRRHTRCSEWSGSLATAGQGYREDCGQLRRKGSGRRSPKHHGGRRTV